MDQIPLVNAEILAGARFLEEFGKSFPIEAALWLKTPGSRQWYLYVAAEKITDETLRPASRELLRITRETKDLRLSPFRVRLIKVSDPIARQALGAYHLHTLPLESVYPIDSFGDMEAEGVYLYPPPVNSAAA